jgi:hypothetical protein
MGLSRLNKPRIIIFILIFLLSIFFYHKCSNFWKIDGCLDHGGAWDYQHEKCDGARSDGSPS